MMIRESSEIYLKETCLAVETEKLIIMQAIVLKAVHQNEYIP